MHTLHSLGFDGSMVLMDNGARPLRVGSKGVAACDIETLSTHGEDGEEFVGAEEDQYYEETQRDNDSGTKIEASKGSPPTQRLTQPSLVSVKRMGAETARGERDYRWVQDRGSVKCEYRDAAGHPTIPGLWGGQPHSYESR